MFYNHSAEDMNISRSKDSLTMVKTDHILLSFPKSEMKLPVIRDSFNLSNQLKIIIKTLYLLLDYNMIKKMTKLKSKSRKHC